MTLSSIQTTRLSRWRPGRSPSLWQNKLRSRAASVDTEGLASHRTHLDEGVAKSSRREVHALRGVDIGRGLTDDQIERVSSRGYRLRVQVGGAMGKSGELGERLFIIPKRDAELRAHSVIGEITVRIAGPDGGQLEIRGEGAIVNGTFHRRCNYGSSRRSGSLSG